MRCPYCGTDEVHKMISMSEAERGYLCESGHSFTHVRFRSARYPQPLLYVEADLPSASCVSKDEMPIMPPNYKVRRVYCGPPADHPAVPTPDELLRHAEEIGRALLDAC